MLRAVADTHALIWYIFSDNRLSPAAFALIQSALASADQIGFSAISLTEIVYLMEKQRVPVTTLQRLLQATVHNNAIFSEVPVDRNIAQAMLRVDRTQIPDLPDRIIAATALHLGLPVISRDHKIRAAIIQSVW